MQWYRHRWGKPRRGRRSLSFLLLLLLFLHSKLHMIFTYLGPHLLRPIVVIATTIVCITLLTSACIKECMGILFQSREKVVPNLTSGTSTLTRWSNHQAQAKVQKKQKDLNKKLGNKWVRARQRSTQVALSVSKVRMTVMVSPSPLVAKIWVRSVETFLTFLSLQTSSEREVNVASDKVNRLSKGIRFVLAATN